MRELHLNDATTDDSRSYLEEIHKIRRRPKVYNTYWTSGGLDFVLMTTSKDVHLRMGQHTPDAITNLCRILDHEFGPNRCTQLLITANLDGDDKVHGGLLVTRVESENRRQVYQLAQAGN